MILRNKLTKETLEITYPGFRKKFAKEIQVALESYTKTENNKPYFKINKNIKSDFYFNLQWNLRLAGRVRSVFTEQNT